MFAICTYILYSYQNVDAHLVGTGFIWEGRCQKNLERFVNVDRTLNVFSYNRTLQVWSKETVTFKWSFRFVHSQYWEVWRFAKFSIYSNILIFTGHNKQFDKIWHFQGECVLVRMFSKWLLLKMYLMSSKKDGCRVTGMFFASSKMQIILKSFMTILGVKITILDPEIAI